MITPAFRASIVLSGAIGIVGADLKAGTLADLNKRQSADSRARARQNSTSRRAH